MIFKIILKQINQIISRLLKHVQKKWTQHTNLSRFYEGRSFKKETKNRRHIEQPRIKWISIHRVSRPSPYHYTKKQLNITQDKKKSIGWNDS